MGELANANLSAALQGIEYDTVAASAVERARGGRILDWGAGEGQLTDRLYRAGADVTAFDFDPEAHGVEELPFKRYPHLTATRTSEPVMLPFDDETFDVVLSCGVLEHVEKPLDSLMELRRVLRPGGSVLIYKLPNRFSILEFVARVAGMPYHGMRVHDTLWGLRSTRWALEATGFEVETVSRANMLPLTVDHPVLNARAQWLWRLNTAMARVPGLGLLSTNVEAVALKPATVRRREIA